MYITLEKKNRHYLRQIDNFFSNDKSTISFSTKILSLSSIELVFRL